MTPRPPLSNLALNGTEKGRRRLSIPVHPLVEVSEYMPKSNVSYCSQGRLSLLFLCMVYLTVDLESRIKRPACLYAAEIHASWCHIAWSPE
ncbi:hypothetical protein CC1G_02984 [Coprinopsis cinerea okayama7|uniref:Uncharacterized protein n=1 Tax=Coprinopsis cinerea (strain Okayama-7 / 130 / ATCC MYA-4618 / FGSC 9003) TaxID=240176 RepID=A8NRZ6_COPC7|nr:hypothetical protein CC1G_02984 [Coprinopsis cinerea okayama7\|eukprot:XP_001835896.2 hypothetical protein CC1G_02984 [Coprinopsis cinerea okayama7\